MSLTFPFKTVGFFNQHEGRTGNMAGHMTPDPSGGSIVFDQPLGSLPRAICVAGNEAAGGYFAQRMEEEELQLPDIIPGLDLLHQNHDSVDVAGRRRYNRGPKNLDTGVIVFDGSD